MGSLAIVNAYTMRISLNIAITEMVETKEQISNESCPIQEKDHGVVQTVKVFPAL